jgi:hypothetical protein
MKTHDFLGPTQMQISGPAISVEAETIYLLKSNIVIIYSPKRIPLLNLQPATQWKLFSWMYWTIS